MADYTWHNAIISAIREAGPLDAETIAAKLRVDRGIATKGSTVEDFLSNFCEKNSIANRGEDGRWYLSEGQQ